MTYKIKDIPTTERPRERLKQIGSSSLSDKELLSIILKTGTKEKNVTDLAIDVLKEFPLTDFQNIKLNNLTKIKGIGEVKAIELLAVIELGKRIFLKTKKDLIKLTCSKEIYLSTRHLFIGKKQEHLYVLYFDNKQKLLTTELLFKGTTNASIAHPRDVFREAILINATYIVCIHNHPSNDTTPSSEDIFFTNQLIKAGKIQGIKVVDHIISGENNFYTFYEKRKIYIKEHL